MRASRTVAVTALAAGLAATACSGGGPTPTKIAAGAAAPSPTASANTGLLPLPTGEPFGVETAGSGDPAGSPVQFAARYLNELRAGEWNAALNEMSYVERTSVFLDDDAAVVGQDVLFNASGGTGQLARCASGRQFATDAVIVRCGLVHVVVHVETATGFRGVQVSQVFVAGDHPGTPHTHAYTQLL